jgi:hypothetical protein
MPGRGRRPATSLTGEQIYAGERERAGDVTDRRRTTDNAPRRKIRSSRAERFQRERERFQRERDVFVGNLKFEDFQCIGQSVNESTKKTIKYECHVGVL